MIDLKSYILDYLKNKSMRSLVRHIKYFKNGIYYKQLLNETVFLDKSIYEIVPSQRIYHILNDVNEIIKCPVCGNEVSFYVNYCYKTCSRKCAREIRKETNLRLYGAENCFQSKEKQEKSKQTNLEKYGTENIMQSKYGQEQLNKSILKRYGVEYPLQNDVIFEKSIKNSHKFKSYILPSGKEVKVQGYEPKFLDEYFKNNGNENDIIIETRDINKYLGIIYYIRDGKKHRYYPDFYLINENKIVEVKSSWTFNQDKIENKLKYDACIDKGLNFEFKIY